MGARAGLLLALLGAGAYLALRLLFDAPQWGAIVGSWAAISIFTSALTLGYQRSVVKTVCETLRGVSDGRR